MRLARGLPVPQPLLSHAALLEGWVARKTTLQSLDPCHLLSLYVSAAWKPPWASFLLLEMLATGWCGTDLRQGDTEFKSSLGDTVKSYLKKP